MTHPVELQAAVSQLAAIQRQLAHAETFRGYRSATLTGTAVAAFAGAGLQVVLCPQPAEQPYVYLSIWVAIAVASVFVSVGQVLWQAWRQRSSLTSRQTWVALEQFLPCTLVGGAVTWAIAERQLDAMWLLPGLWSGLFGLGVLSSSRQLPRPVAWVGAYYLAAAALPLLAGPQHAGSPWWMLLSFGVGQSAMAVILYVYLERTPVAGEEE
jgi:hypothetical protein